jgi:hemoglobin
MSKSTFSEKRKFENRDDIEFVVGKFYEKVKLDPLIGPVFQEQAKVDWEAHLPKIFDFWESLLFGKEIYYGRPFPPHLALDLKLEHFQRWLGLFFETVDENAQGEKAEEIKSRALMIGKNFYSRIEAIREAEKTSE